MRQRKRTSRHQTKRHHSRRRKQQRKGGVDYNEQYHVYKIYTSPQGQADSFLIRDYDTREQANDAIKEDKKIFEKEFRSMPTSTPPVKYVIGYHGDKEGEEATTEINYEDVVI